MPATNISFVIPPDQLQKLSEKLSPGQYKQATFQVVKRTTAQVAKLVRNEITDQITINKKYANRFITTRNPQGDPPVGAVVISSMLVPLIAFEHHPARTSPKGSGVTVNIRKSPTVIRTLKHAFIATVKNVDRKTLETVEHKGIFLRSRHLPTRGPGSYLKDRKGKLKYKLTPREFAGRLAIDQEFGPRISDLISIPSVLKRLNFDASAYMMKQAQSQIDRFTKAKPPAAE